MADDYLEPTHGIIAHMKALAPALRTAHLQTLIGEPTDNPMILHRRALLVTRLREEGLWPIHCAEPGTCGLQNLTE